MSESFLQPWVFLVCVFLGGVVCILYKLTHPVLSKNVIVLSLQDFVFCATAFFVLWRGLLFANCGQLRWFCVAGILTGLLLGLKLVGVYVDIFVVKLYNFFTKHKTGKDDG